MEKTAPVFNIQKFCTHDGSGIRTTVFLKGCNMRCQWCANPESLERNPQLLFYQDKCKGCGDCINLCSESAITIEDGKIVQNRELCINCGKCAEACFFDARALLGKERGVSEVFEEIKKDKLFYDTSGGGVTFSGGEPMLHIDFIEEITEKCRAEGIHVVAETCGCFPEGIADRAAVVDEMLFDLKLIDEEKHYRYCGCTNRKILNNFKRACRLTKVQPRIPIIPGINDTKEDIELLAGFLKECGAEFPTLHILPYHNLGACKYLALGMDYALDDLPVPDNTYMGKVKKEFESYGFSIRIGG